MTDTQSSAVTRKRTVARSWAAVLVFLLVFAQTAAIVILAAVALGLNDRAKSNHELLSKVDATARILLDCTTPGHPCYQRGQQATSDAIEQLNRIIVLAAFCAREPTNRTVDQIAQCISTGLKP